MKKIIRQEILNKREGLDQQAVQEKSEKIYDLLTATDHYQKAQCVMLFLSFRNEVDTNKIIQDLLKANKRVFIPVTVPKTKALIVSELKDPINDLEVGTFGVLEPKKEALRPVSPDLLDLIIVPGVAFDKRGYRIGYGAGYYDRFLPNINPQVPLIALALEVQMIDLVPNDNYDFPVQYIITENQIITCRG
ncbi:5-formyltetrahydrofolate cyclo-ligase [Alkaliphilus transvaalensis]|uniref:5-formyltetrahydrofolate cyclo-ligase n=1 Tax=Alkaliphilus transvaalensis TaxID=114628 RepID=UPI0006883C99|nr:5-formyltetrahydrofolate cyclo-ligase [Alkaliphilus transvaalensis]